jgi:hypothetical protein
MLLHYAARNRQITLLRVLSRQSFLLSKSIKTSNQHEVNQPDESCNKYETQTAREKVLSRSSKTTSCHNTAEAEPSQLLAIESHTSRHNTKASRRINFINEVDIKSPKASSH